MAKDRAYSADRKRLKAPKGSFRGILKGFHKGSIVGFYNLRASIIRIGFGGILYYRYNTEPPKIVLAII